MQAVTSPSPRNPSEQDSCPNLPTSVHSQPISHSQTLQKNSPNRIIHLQTNRPAPAPKSLTSYGTTQTVEKICAPPRKIRQFSCWPASVANGGLIFRRSVPRAGTRTGSQRIRIRRQNKYRSQALKPVLTGPNPVERACKPWGVARKCGARNIPNLLPIFTAEVCLLVSANARRGFGRPSAPSSS